MKLFPVRLKKILRWLKDIWRWLAEGKSIWMGIFIIIAAIMLGFYAWCSHQSIRIAGFSLQILGMCFAIRGLLSIRQHFGHPKFRILLLSWIKRYPHLNKKHVIEVDSAIMTTAVMKANIDVWAPDKPDEPLEKRFDLLIRNVNRLKESQDNTIKGLDKVINDLEKHSKRMVDANKNLEEKIQKDREQLHTGNFLESLIGLVWLAIGITFTTLAPEFFFLINKVFR